MEVTLPLFQKLFDEKATFCADGKTLPLIERVSSRRHALILALHEHPKALEIFFQEAKKEGISLEQKPQKIASQNINKTQNDQKQNNG